MYKINSHLVWTLGLVAALLLVRFISLSMYPLFDTTEARYSEMARLMFETKNWVTPLFDYNVPFWGKPPFQTWISAASFSLFGVSEFSARLPHFICGCLVLVLTYYFALRISNKYQARLAVLVLASSLGFIISMGMVMTDTALLLATTLAMMSYWRCYQFQDKNISGHIFFFALAMGMLIKGPVAVVLVVISLVSWSLWQRCFLKALRSLPWFSGLLLFLLITLPWYLLAESATPGFLEYFILGEHIQRFLVSGWQGDLYGTAHDEPRGMIWLFWLGAAFPWSFIVIYLAISKLTNKPLKTYQDVAHQGVSSYLICWMISPMLLFTFSGNILSAYVLPGFSAMAVLIALKQQLYLQQKALALGSLLLIACLLSYISLGLSSKSSESQLLRDDIQLPYDVELYYLKQRPFSARFYSNGQALLLDNNEELINRLTKPRSFYLAMTHQEFLSINTQIENFCSEQNRSRKRLLLKCNDNKGDNNQ